MRDAEVRTSVHPNRKLEPRQFQNGTALTLATPRRRQRRTVDLICLI